MPIRCLVFLLAALALLPANPAAAQSPLDKALAVLDENADLLRKDLGVPGVAVAVVQGDQVVFKKCWGLRNAGAADAVDPDTVFQIASISKSFTATLAAMEMAAGRLSSTDRVCNLRPNFKLYDPWVTREFTVEDLMAHRSGLLPCAGDNQLMFGKGRDELSAALQYIPPATSFRSAYAYQNVPFIETGYIVEQTSKLTWEQNLYKRLFAPLGMTSASADLKGYLGSKNRAALHQMQHGKLVALADDWPWMGVAYIVGPAGGINASLNDMIPYLTMHMNHGKYKGAQIVDAKALDDLHRPRTPLGGGILGRQAFYCQGFLWEECDGYTLVWHNGGSPGHKSILIFDPDAKLGMVVLSNLLETQLPEYLASILFRIYHNPQSAPALGQELRKRAQASRQPAPGPTIQANAKASRPLTDYVGDYTSQVYGTLHVTTEGGSLLVALGRIPVRFPLAPTGEPDTFYLELPFVDDDASGNAVFHADQSGRIRNVELVKFRDNGPPMFTRN
jgi:CubicO group peptidase (beta-lactamase class C family)